MLILLLILLVGLLLRVILLFGPGFYSDEGLYYQWGKCADESGILAVYQCPTLTDHPPADPTLMGLSMTLFHALGGSVDSIQHNPALIAALKLPGMIFETLLVALFFRIAYAKAGLGWATLLTVLLYFNPGWLIVTAWWGQTDAVYSFLLLLTAYLLTQRRARWMWAIYALAWLARFQSVLFLPVFLIMSVRRCGLRATLEGLVVFALVFAAGVVPFVIGSGSIALRPFVGAVNQYPAITNNAYNLWYWVGGGLDVSDKTALIGGVTYFQAGFALLGIVTLLLCLRAWFLGERDDEYLVLAAAGFSFYMLPTQIHERYLYPGLMFLALAMIRDWRLIAVYVLSALVFTGNVFDTVWLGIDPLVALAKLIFWKPIQAAAVLTVTYVGLIAMLLIQLWKRRQRDPVSAL